MRADGENYRVYGISEVVSDQKDVVDKFDPLSNKISGIFICI